MRLTLAEARKRRRIDVEELVLASGVSRATVYRIEAGEVTNPSNDTVKKLEAALKLRRGMLVFGQAREARAS